MLKPMIAMALALCLALPAAAQDADDDDDLPAGLLAGPNKQDLPEIILSVGEPLGEGLGDVVQLGALVVGGLGRRRPHAQSVDRLGQGGVGRVDGPVVGQVQPGRLQLLVPGQ